VRSRLNSKTTGEQQLHTIQSIAKYHRNNVQTARQKRRGAILLILYRDDDATATGVTSMTIAR